MYTNKQSSNKNNDNQVYKVANDTLKDGPPKLNLLVNGCAQYGYGVYTYVSFWDTKKKRSAPKDRRRVGKIENKQRNGKIIFNESFLAENPIYAQYDAYREGANTYFIPKDVNAENKIIANKQLQPLHTKKEAKEKDVS